MTVYEMAKQYYPKLWDENRLTLLVNAGKLTEEEKREIVGKTVDATLPM